MATGLLRVWCFLAIQVLMLFGMMVVAVATLIPVLLLVQTVERFLP